MNGLVGTFRRRLVGWYRISHRSMPWRVVGGLPDAYGVLVSEAMLQQTQVATVVPYFLRFMEQWPTVGALAGAEEQAVLRAWAGLGYYSRARNLHRAAGVIVGRFGGVVPGTVEELRSLPGVGRYTAGAVASIAYDKRAAIVDGNVIRVLCRLDRIEGDPRMDKALMEGLWRRAEAILPRRGCGDFNSGLMELGATVCTPRNPRCLVCPVRAHCEAAEAGVAEMIPPPKKAKATPLRRRWTFCIRQGGKYLLEQRPMTGRWAGMWQFVTMEAGDGSPTTAEVEDGLGVTVGDLRSMIQFDHVLTHRRYRFEGFVCEWAGSSRQVKEREKAGRKWLTLSEIDAYPLAKPQLRILEKVARAARP